MFYKKYQPNPVIVETWLFLLEGSEGRECAQRAQEMLLKWFDGTDQLQTFCEREGITIGDVDLRFFVRGEGKLHTAVG